MQAHQSLVHLVDNLGRLSPSRYGSVWRLKLNATICRVEFARALKLVHHGRCELVLSLPIPETVSVRTTPKDRVGWLAVHEVHRWLAVVLDSVWIVSEIPGIHHRLLRSI